MRLLHDTHVLIWVTAEPDRVSNEVLRISESLETELVPSAASVWEVAITRTLGREDFDVDPRLLRIGLLESGYSELGITGARAAAVDSLPPIHKNPFDWILIAQALAESFMLLTGDPIVAQYPGPIMSVWASRLVCHAHSGTRCCGRFHHRGAELAGVRGVVLLIGARDSQASVRSLLL